MALFSNFCNICYKIDDESLKDISEENMKHINDIMITFVGHADIIKFNVIYLCQSCCDELTRFDKFRDMCLSNLIQFRERCINMKLELQDDDACAVKNTLQKFVNEEVLGKNSLEKSNRQVLISTNCHEIIKSPADVNKDCLVFNKEVNLQLQTNDYEFDDACSEVSGINSVNECDESPVTVMNEEDIKKEVLRYSENTRSEKFEAESDENFDVAYANNDNKGDILQIEFWKEEYDLKSERENSDSENFTLKNYENESDEYANLDVKVPVASTKENSASKSLELQTMENGVDVAFEVANVCTLVNMEDSGHRNIRIEDAEVGMKLRSRSSNNKSTASLINTHPSHLHVREDRNGRRPTALRSAAGKRVHPDAKPHTCVVCNESFRSKSYLVRHEGIHSGNRIYKCSVCNKVFKNSSNLSTHERIHSGDRPYKCNVCNKTFTQSGNLAAHTLTHSGDKAYKCNVCNKTFTQPSSLIRHELVHSGARPYKCTICNKAFAYSHSLSTHERIHSGDRPYKCIVCNKTFTQSSALMAHKRTHSDDKPYKCTVCDKTFAGKNNLKTHERIHSGDRPFKCTVCNKAFAQPSSLAAHKQTHRSDKPYKCTVCDRAFTHLSYLTKHEYVHIDRPCKCTECKSFRRTNHFTNTL